MYLLHHDNILANTAIRITLTTLFFCRRSRSSTMKNTFLFFFLFLIVLQTNCTPTPPPQNVLCQTKPEICGNHTDDNCDGMIDEDCPWYIRIHGKISSQHVKLSPDHTFSILYGFAFGKLDANQHSFHCEEGVGFSWMIKVSYTGKTEWSYSFPCGSQMGIEALDIDERGNVYLAVDISDGKINVASSVLSIEKTKDERHHYVLQFSPEGKPSWAIPMKGAFLQVADLKSFSANAQTDSITLVGSYRKSLSMQGKEINSPLNTDMTFAAKLQADGKVLWLKNLFDEKLKTLVLYPQATIASISSMGHLLIHTLQVDESSGQPLFPAQSFLFSLNDMGEIKWSFSFHLRLSTITQIHSISENIFLAFFSFGQETELLGTLWTPHPLPPPLEILPSNDVLALRVKSSGEVIDSKHIGGDDSDYATSLKQKDEIFSLVSSKYTYTPPSFGAEQPKWLQKSASNETKHVWFLAKMNEKKEQYTGFLPIDPLLQNLQKETGTQGLQPEGVYGRSQNLYYTLFSNRVFQRERRLNEQTWLWGRFRLE